MEEFGAAVHNELESVTDRYYKKYYALDIKSRPGTDHCILQHSNRVCVVCLSPTHELLRTPNIEILKIEFQIGKLDRTANVVSGKLKRGQKLTANSPLCFVHTNNRGKYVLYSCIKGTLLEVNENLLSNPSLLLQKPLEKGYIAIVLPKLSTAEDVCTGLLTEDEYKAVTGLKETHE